jgi:diguanylate cyclase (GGDEF)-like protein
MSEKAWYLKFTNIIWVIVSAMLMRKNPELFLFIAEITGIVLFYVLAITLEMTSQINKERVMNTLGRFIFFLAFLNILHLASLDMGGAIMISHTKRILLWQLIMIFESIAIIIVVWSFNREIKRKVIDIISVASITFIIIFSFFLNPLYLVYTDHPTSIYWINTLIIASIFMISLIRLFRLKQPGKEKLILALRNFIILTLISHLLLSFTIDTLPVVHAFGHLLKSLAIVGIYAQVKKDYVLMSINSMESNLNKANTDLNQMVTYAHHDSLTGDYNRRHMNEYIERHLPMEDLTTVFVDIDGLKNINDIQGHEMGDQAIIATSKILHEVFRKDDIIIRYGGDEFVILVNDSSSEGWISNIQERLDLKTKVHNRKSEMDLRISVSAGYSYSNKVNTMEDFSKLIKEADIEMYSRRRNYL